jgi:hypothetical protein
VLDRGSPVRTERVAGSSRPLVMLVAAAIVSMLLVVAKPWGPSVSGPSPDAAALPNPAPAGPVGRSRQAVSPRGAAAIAPPRVAAPSVDAETAAALGRRQCWNPDLWRIVTRERSGTSDVRSLFPIDPVAASAPSDPAIEVQTVHASQLLGIGYCVPLGMSPEVATLERHVVIWNRSGDGSYVSIRGARVLDQGLYDLGEVYLGPPAASPQPAWPAGRYVFELAGAASDGSPRWFAVDVMVNRQ